MKYSLRSLLVVAILAPPLLAYGLTVAGTISSLELLTALMFIMACVVFFVCAAATLRPVH